VRQYYLGSVQNQDSRGSHLQPSAQNANWTVTVFCEGV